VSITYIANEPRARRRFWTLERRARKAAEEAVLGLDVCQLGEREEIDLRLQTGERFLVRVVGGKVASINQASP